MRFRHAIVLALLLALPARGGELPDLGESVRAGFDEAQEARLGQEIMLKLRASSSYLDDPEILDYLNTLGDRLAASSPNPYTQYEFFAVRDASINAFALPGGHIGVHTGLISAARNESELAGVLAHEIAHVTQNHIARLVDAQKTAGWASLAALAVAILASRASGQAAQAAATIGQAVGVQAQLNYTRDNEREADRVGLGIITSAAYDAQGMAGFFERMQEQTRFNESNAPAYLRTHPMTYERIADLQNRLAAMPALRHEDSLEFRLIRTRIQAAEGETWVALQRFTAATQGRGEEDGAAWYGLSRAALRAGQIDTALRAAQRVEALHTASPMVALLMADILRRAGQGGQALEKLAAALKRHSAYRPLAYAYAAALIEARQARQALAFLDEQLYTWPDEARLYAIQANAHQALGQSQDAHLAQAEAYLRQGADAAAMEQLQLALKAGGRDFYKLSIIEARLRALRERQEKAR